MYRVQVLGLKVLGFGGCVTNSREASGGNTQNVTWNWVPMG